MKCSYLYNVMDSPEAPAEKGTLCAEPAEFTVNGDYRCLDHATAQMRARESFDTAKPPDPKPTPQAEK